MIDVAAEENPVHYLVHKSDSVQIVDDVVDSIEAMSVDKESEMQVVLRGEVLFVNSNKEVAQSSDEICDKDVVHISVAGSETVNYNIGVLKQNSSEPY